MYEIDFSIVKDEQGDVVGFSLEAGFDRLAECYLRQLPKWLSDNTMTMAFIGNNLIFFKDEGEENLRFTWDAEELASLKQVLEGKQKLKLEKLSLSGLLNTGFKIIKE